VGRESAGPYPRERFKAHLDALAGAVAGDAEMDDALRNLAPHLALSAISEA
jgi:hypothetical protein